MLAFMTAETAVVGTWFLLIILFVLICWFSNTAFLRAVREGEMPSEARTVFYRRLVLFFSLFLILGLLLYVLREPVFYDVMGIGL